MVTRQRITLNARGRALHAVHAKKAGSVCCLCERPALRRAGTKGYCRLHLEEARQHQKVVASARASSLRGELDRLVASDRLGEFRDP